MAVFDHSRRFLLLLIVAAWISALEPWEVEAAVSNAMKEMEAQRLHTAYESRTTFSQSVTMRKRKALRKEPAPAEFRRQNPSSQRNRDKASRGKVAKHFRPRDYPQLDQELAYHGILENQRRYDPSPNQKTGAVPNPRVRELRVDHFQELDKNYDGVLDPFERATSRLDIDRDLSNRGW